MNSLLKLEFFKSLSFPSKETGMEFIKQNPKLKKEIEVKVDEMEEAKYLVLESIREEIFPKYSEKKEVFIMKSKMDKNVKLAEKKELQKKALKEDLREELLKELKEEKEEESKRKLMKKYPKAVPEFIKDFSFGDLEQQFLRALQKVESGDIDSDELIVIEKAKEQIEKAMLVIMKAKKTIEKY